MLKCEITPQFGDDQIFPQCSDDKILFFPKISLEICVSFSNEIRLSNNRKILV